MTYQSKIIYPKEEETKDNKFTELALNETIEKLEQEDIIKQYEGFLAKGYSVGVTFQPPKLENEGKEVDPFVIATRFEMAGIPYKATLKLKASGEYEYILKAAKLIEQQGFDYSVTANLDINEKSTVDLAKEGTWFDPDNAKYTLKPKASSKNIDDLKTLYVELKKENYKVSIDLKSKAKKDDDENFSSQLLAYPEGTTVTFKLTEASI